MTGADAGATETRAGFPGTLYDGDGTRLVGEGAAVFTPAMEAGLPYKALVRGEPGGDEEKVAVLTAGDRLWLLPDSLGAASEASLAAAIVELAGVVRRGRKVGLIGRDPGVFTLARDALVLLLDDSGGRA